MNAGPWRARGARLLVGGLAVGVAAVSGACSADQRRAESAVLSLTQSLCLMRNHAADPAWLATACAIDEALVPHAKELLDTHATAVTSAHARGAASAAASACPVVPRIAPAPAPPAAPARTVTVENPGPATVVFVAFGSDSVVLPAAWPTCTAAGALNCSFALAAKAVLVLPVAGYLNATLSLGGPVGCGFTKVELNLSNPRWYDTTDISLVDGFSMPARLEMDGKAFGVTSAKGNEKSFGVFPLGCDVCVAREHPPCGMKPGGTGCKTGSQYKPSVPCQYQGPTMGGGGNVRILLNAVPA